MAIRALGTTIQHLAAYNTGGTPDIIGSLSSVGEISATSDEIDVTALDSTSGWREFLQGFKDSGELTLIGFHDASDTGQETCRTLYGTGANGYWWVTFPDKSVIIFTAFVKGYTAGPAEVDGAVGFGLALRITGLIQVIESKAPVAQTVTVSAVTEEMDSTATAYTGTPTYEWYEVNDLDYTSPVSLSVTTAVCDVPAGITAGVHYYYCSITVSGYRAVPSEIHVITAEE
jgi:predicted secreted protein